MKRMFAAIMAMIMMLALAGCGGSDADALVGNWAAEIDMSSLTNDMLAEMGMGMEEYFQFEDFAITMDLTFNDDGTYSFAMNEDSVKAAVDTMLVTIEDGMIKMLEDQIAEYGLDMTVDEMLAASGMSMDDLMAELDAEALVDEMMADSDSEGNYKAKDGKLYLSDGKDYAVDENIYDTYELDGDTLTLTEHFGEEDEDEQAFEDEMYPIVFNKK